MVFIRFLIIRNILHAEYMSEINHYLTLALQIKCSSQRIDLDLDKL